MESNRPAIVAAVIILAAVVLLLFSSGNGGGFDDTMPDDGGPEKRPEGTVTGPLPEGLTLDEVTGAIMSDGPVTWHVFNRLHTFYDTDRFGSSTSQYTGDKVTSESLPLEPGSYLVTVGGESFDVKVYGTVERTITWEHDKDGVSKRASVTYRIDMYDLLREWDIAEGLNSSSNSDFANLPGLVVLSDTTSELQRSLNAEYVKLGGSKSDVQGYLDFLVSMVQEGIAYPHTIPGHSWDYGTFGVDEYWSTPLQTLYLKIGDCEDNSALICALLTEAGYRTAMGGKSGHAFAGVALDFDFVPVSTERLVALGVGHTKLTSHVAVNDVDGTVYYAIESIRKQTPVGYIGSVSFGYNTFWGLTGFYPVEASR